MNALDWDHNAYYHRLLLRHLPRPCNRVLDVGCGAGAFAVELAKRAEHVDALDRSPAMIEEAKRVAPPNVTCILADVLREPLPDARYDAIVSISALHHTPLEEVLPRLAGALRPGGVLAAAALPRRDLPQELPAELTAAIGHRLLGTAFATLRACSRRRWYAKELNQIGPQLCPGAICRRSCPPSSPRRSATGCSGPHLPPSELVAADAGTRRNSIRSDRSSAPARSAAGAARRAHRGDRPPAARDRICHPQSL